ncbi:GNAT family N-acetyltransferase [Magnetovibrio sp. PR-2]|uniref:GNAT family N-acetyltransferase n=1 Tax=Magnetovibrio sp. PR-2 TaxID=3120356 RepID=UPI002FCDE9E2
MMVDVLGYIPAFSKGVRDLIVPIQQAEFGIDITYDDQPDLQDIPGFYQNGTGNFWVVVDGVEVVGTIALKDIGNGQAALRKMFVAESHRGRDKGVAAELLQTLLGHARMTRLQTIYLGTTPQFKAAHRFYEKHGFEQIAPETLPEAFPRMAVDTRFYRLTL